MLRPASFRRHENHRGITESVSERSQAKRPETNWIEALYHHRLSTKLGDAGGHGSDMASLPQHSSGNSGSVTASVKTANMVQMKRR
jgi:hypothetical protein